MNRAEEFLDVAECMAGGPLPVRLTLWDGSVAGPPDGVPVTVRSKTALRQLVWAPGELGFARAYVTGDLDVPGDLEAGLSLVMAALRHGRSAAPTRLAATSTGRRLSDARRMAPAALRGAALLARERALWPRPRPPRSEARVKGRRHSPVRDAQVISHHYDVSNRFYTLLLDPSMAYSCGYWASDEPAYTLADAQRDKLDLVCRKLALRPGTRLLDVGCGWGSLTVHAAREYGARVTAVTIARAQHDRVAERIAAEGMADLVDLRLADWREVAGSGGYDAVAAIEMAEHVGEEHYPLFLDRLRSSLRPGGRLLVQAMSRRTRPGGGPFIERYIAPDMHMRPVAATVGHIEAAGLEVRDVQSLREDYARTIRAWRAQMERRWPEVVALLGEEQARVWRLYLAGGALSFEQNRMGVDQILAVSPCPDGSSRTAPVRTDEKPSRLMEAAH